MVDGLARIVSTSLRVLSEQLDPSTVTKADRQPMLETELTLMLVGSEITSSPDRFETAKRYGVLDVVDGWVESLFNLTTIFKQLQNSMTIFAELQLIEFMQNNKDQIVLLRNKYEKYFYLWTTTDLQQAYFAEFVESATLAVRDLGNTILNLGKFKMAITNKYRQVQAEINDLVTPSDIGWIRVNSQPMKQALGVWVTKGIYLHTQHLAYHVKSTLSGLILSQAASLSTAPRTQERPARSRPKAATTLSTSRSCPRQ